MTPEKEFIRKIAEMLATGDDMGSFGEWAHNQNDAIETLDEIINEARVLIASDHKAKA